MLPRNRMPSTHIPSCASCTGAKMIFQPTSRRQPSCARFISSRKTTKRLGKITRSIRMPAVIACPRQPGSSCVASRKGEQNYDRAVTEYELLAKAHPNERQSLLALLSAGRLSLKKLNRPADALKFYKAAAASSVPHLDWESNIQAGIQDAQKQLQAPSVPVA